jgi:hypothetical protein
MKELLTFNNAIDALSYHSYCPFCAEQLLLFCGSKDYDISRSSNFLHLRSDDSKVDINLYTNKFNLELIRTMPYAELDEGFGYSKISRKSSPWDNTGYMVIGIIKECLSCCSYSHILMFHFDLTERCLKSATLNSEWMSIEKSPDVFEINNNYVTDITQYTHHNNNGDSKKYDFPIILINLINPEETLERLHKLIIFT